ncbi:PHP-associated domain-containing protein [Desulfurivibrio sp. D14AmB]|uniref:PHP domain-containing protein n=1 Tax=Desulfurivibrio sp. D14AmB TaxID=3374370 RepID=UPI00376F3F5E
MLFDLHVHTRLSACSSLGLDQILLHARARGLDGVCLTDHDTMAAGRTLREGIQPDGLCVLLGMEYATPQGDFLLFGPFENMPTGLAADLLLPMVERGGGVAVAAHPFRALRPAQETVIASGACRVVEGLNGRNSARENRRVDRWLKRYPLSVCGGSDAHTLDELGRVATRFEQPVRNRRELIQALRTGACQGVNLGAPHAQ